jgi:hypothetical protein
MHEEQVPYRIATAEHGMVRRIALGHGCAAINMSMLGGQLACQRIDVPKIDAHTLTHAL